MYFTAFQLINSPKIQGTQQLKPRLYLKMKKFTCPWRSNCQRLLITHVSRTQTKMNRLRCRFQQKTIRKMRTGTLWLVLKMTLIFSMMKIFPIIILPIIWITRRIRIRRLSKGIVTDSNKYKKQKTRKIHQQTYKVYERIVNLNRWEDHLHHQ